MREGRSRTYKLVINVRSDVYERLVARAVELGISVQALLERAAEDYAARERPRRLPLETNGPGDANGRDERR
ncbi:MAG: hypothetical protein ACREM2_05595 [Vulcanimicrobiaceae bacterium]